MYVCFVQISVKHIYKHIQISNDGRRHNKYFTNYGIYFKRRLLLCLHFYNKLHSDHHQMSLINTIEHFSISSFTFSISVIQTIFHIQVHTALASGHIQENSSAASKTTILFLKAQAIENKTEYKLKPNMK